MQTTNKTPTEIELKLRLTEDAAAALERAPPLASTAAADRHELTRYFDTPDLALAARGYTLRIRISGDRRIQTLKTPSSDGSAASQRGEWEWPVDSDEPALDLLAGTPAADLTATLTRRLEPVFATDIHRRARRVQVDGTEIEAAHDRGAIQAATGCEDVNELELELKQGAAGALYRLAIALHETVPMRLAPESKAARGYRLRTGSASEAVHAPKPHLPNKARANEAFRVIVASSLQGVLANIPAVEATNPEGVHQLRVGLRRLRSALVLFKPMLEPHATKLFSDELRQLGRVFGARRDLDVFCLQTLPAFSEGGFGDWVEPLRNHAERGRDRAQSAVMDALRGPGFTSLALGLAAWCENGVGDCRLLGGPRWGKQLDAVLPPLLDRLAHTVQKRAERLDTPEQLHDLRKSLKKLRYATEFVAGLFDPKAVKRFRAHCEALQEQLGVINDMAVTPALAETMMDERSLELAPAIAALAGWSAERRQHALGKLRTALRHFRKAKPFWH